MGSRSPSVNTVRSTVRRCAPSFGMEPGLVRSHGGNILVQRVRGKTRQRISGKRAKRSGAFREFRQFSTLGIKHIGQYCVISSSPTDAQRGTALQVRHLVRVFLSLSHFRPVASIFESFRMAP